MTDKVPADKMPLSTPGYGPPISHDGPSFKRNSPLMAHDRTAADIIIQAPGKKESRMDPLKGRKPALVRHVTRREAATCPS